MVTLIGGRFDGQLVEFVSDGYMVLEDQWYMIIEDQKYVRDSESTAIFSGHTLGNFQL